MSGDSDIVSFRATLDGEEIEVDYRPGEALLDCMLADGLDPAFQCKVLSKRDLEQNYVLLCQSIPLTGDVWVDCDA